MTSVSGSKAAAGCGLGRSGRGCRVRGGGVEARGGDGRGGVVRDDAGLGGDAGRSGSGSGSGAACLLGRSAGAPVTLAMRSATVTPSVWLPVVSGGSVSS